MDIYYNKNRKENISMCKKLISFRKWKDKGKKYYDLILTRQNFKNSQVTTIKTYQKKKKRKQESMQGMDIKIWRMKKKRKENNIWESITKQDSWIRWVRSNQKIE